MGELIVMNRREEADASEPESGPDITEVDFGSFFDEHYARLYRALVLVTRRSHDAEEITQEAFARCWAKWDRVSSLEDPVGYLYRVAMNAHRQTRRRALRAARHVVSPDHASDEAPGSVELLDELGRLFLRLPARQRAALVVTEYLGYDSAEAARILGVRPGTVRTLVSKAKSRLRKEGSFE